MSDWKRIASLVRARRSELGLTQEDLLGVSSSSVRLIERAARTTYRESTIVALERALQWAPGSIGAIGRGGEPMLWPANAAEGAGFKPVETEAHLVYDTHTPATEFALGADKVIFALDGIAAELLAIVSAEATFPARQADSIILKLGELGEATDKFRAALGEMADQVLEN